MAITYAALEAELIGPLNRKMAFAGLDVAPSTPTTPNLDAMRAIAWAASRSGAVLATAGVVTDADVAGLPDFYLTADLARLRMLEGILSDWTRVTESVQGRSKSTSDLLTALEDWLKALRTQYAAYLMPNRGGVVAGPVRFPFPTPRDPRWGLGHGRVDH